MNTAWKKLRNRKTKMAGFRAAAEEAAADLCRKTVSALKGKRPATIVVILRAGLALLPAFIKKFPDANIGFVGLKRNERTLLPREYYRNIPRFKKGNFIILLDPMLATGGSAEATIKILKKTGAIEQNIIGIFLIATEDGENRLKKKFPKIRFVIGSRGEKLTKSGLISPGLGDFGDRYFGKM